ncbi:MAG: beta-galactosidase [Opitutaceae bacterium]|jgi:hypothetical protein|nr:beta-galactosidase [Opitutaceae bacterium]
MPPIRAHLALTLPLIAAVLPAQSVNVPSAAPDPLDNAAAYTLELPADNGAATDNWFYMAFVHGMPRQYVHMGFTARQLSGRGSAPFYTKPLAENPFNDGHALRYYSLGWGAESLGLAIRSAKTRVSKNPDKASEADRRLAALPPALDPKGEPYKNGRSLLNLHDPATLDHLKNFARAHVTARHAANGALVRYWGLDNEWEGVPDYGPQARAHFAAWLRKAYANDLAALNEAWSTDLPPLPPGSFLPPGDSAPARHTTFEAAANSDAIPAPADYAKRPGAWLDWITFQTEHFTTALADISRAMHDADPLHRGVVHKSTQQTLEMPAVNRGKTFDHELFAELMRPISGGLLGTDMYGSGDRQAYETNYIYNCIRPRNRAPGYGVFLPETNNHNGPGHAFASTNWRMLANGLKAADFFTLGFAGAKDDWDKFGFHNSATGAPRDKLHYAARWAHMVHRTETFWKNAVPADGLPRIALHLPRRDVLLSEKSPRSTSRWGYPRNHRWLVYRWLREQGYWVDVIPSTKLHPGYLRAYDALALIGAEHLAPDEAAAITRYVREDGGILIADTRPGHYDQHHRIRDQLAPLLGVTIGEKSDSGSDSGAGVPPAPVASPRIQLTINSGHARQTLIADTTIATVVPTTARVLATGSTGSTGSTKKTRPIAYLNTLPRTPNAELQTPNTKPGRVLYFPFELGSTLLEKPAEAMKAFLLDGPTADREEYARQQGELAIGRWLGDRLREAGLTPAVVANKKLADTGNLRVEQPFIDKSGNIAIVIATRADTEQRPLPAGAITLPLPPPSPGQTWTTAWWAPAEDDSLTALTLRPVTGDRYEITLPPIPGAGVLYLFCQHAPVLSIPAIATKTRAIDGHTASLPPGAPCPLTVELINTTAAPLPTGVLRAQALAHWQITPSATADTPELAPGKSHKTTFTLTPPTDVALVKPDWLYPLVATWHEHPAHESGTGFQPVSVASPRGGGVPPASVASPQAILTANVVMDIPAGKALHILTDNAHYPDTYPYRTHTGATYHYTTPTPDTAAISDPAQRGKNTPPDTALTNGFNSRTGGRTTGGNASAYNASYTTRAIAVDFDLKAPRAVRRAVVNAGPGDMRPLRITLATSADGKTFVQKLTQTTASSDTAIREYTLTLPAAVSARYVRLAIEWPLVGGTLDEVEIWGN